MRKNIDEVASQAGQMLAELGYKPGAIQHYKTTWNKARRWCSERGIEWFETDQEHQLLEDLGLNEDALSPGNRSMLRHIRTLLSLDKVGCLPSFSRALPDDVPDRFRQVFDAYASHLEQRGLAHPTRLGQISVIRRFMTGLGIKNFGELSMEDVTAHMEACSWMTPQTRAGILYTIRAFTKWAAAEGLCSPDVAAAMPLIPGHKHASLPSAYAVSEVVNANRKYIETCRRLLELSSVKTPKTVEVEFLSVRAVQLVVAAAADDLRDLAIVSVLCDSGARVSEVCGMAVGDLTFSRPHTAKVTGKGRKGRVIPLSSQVGEILSRYITTVRPHSAPTDQLFVNRSRNPLGRAGVAYVLQKSVTAAHNAHPEEVPLRVHLHVMRHSKAMHLLEAGVNLVYIRDFLGHESVTTTEIYARASTEAKRRAIESAEQNIVPESPYGKEQRADLVAWLRSLL